MSAADIFGSDAEIFTKYAVELRFRHLVVGGIPSDKSVIEGWIRSRMELGDKAIDELVAQTIKERGLLTPDETVAEVLKSDLAPSVNGFKRDADGVPCLEGRIIKAALKEWINSSYPGTDWPGKKKHTATSSLRKGLMRYSAEAVMVPEILVPLEDAEGPVEVQERVKHVQTPQGPRSTLNRVEVLLRPTVRFTVLVRDDFLPQEAWGRVWATGETIGLGSERGRSDGTFDLLTWTAK